MKRFVATARGRVQRVGYREHVYNETFERNISGYVMNLKNGEVEIVAEGSEKDLREFINEINIIRRPIAVKSFTIRWEEATGEYADFEIIRGDIQEETFERMDYLGHVLYSIWEHSVDMNAQHGSEIRPGPPVAAYNAGEAGPDAPTRQRDERRDCRAPERFQKAP